MKKHNQSPLQVSIVIPVFNNERTLLPELTRILAVMEKSYSSFEILISDDKSTDATLSHLEQFEKRYKQIRILRNKKNLGIAENIQQLYKKARNPYILLYSADGDWDFRDIRNLLETVEQNDYDLVIGERASRAGYSLSRRIVSYAYNLLPRILFNVDTKDAGSIKVFKKNLLLKQHLQSKSIFYESELIIRSHKNGYKIGSTIVNYRRRRKRAENSIQFRHVHLAIRDLIALKRSFSS
jgi:glycosyltransferase involved in cell wall biosynthesis